MSLGMLIAMLAGVFGITLACSVILESVIGYRKERRHKNDRRNYELRKKERRRSTFQWAGPEHRNIDRRNIQRRVLDRRSELRVRAA